MDFIERLFGIAPDGGNGLVELAVFLAVTAVLMVGSRASVLRPRGRLRR